MLTLLCFFFFQAEDGIRDIGVTGVQTCALPIYFAGGQFLSSREAVEIEARRGDDAGLHANIAEPVGGGAEELATGEIVVDGLAQIIKRGERADDKAVVPGAEIVAGDDADAERIAGIGGAERRIIGPEGSLGLALAGRGLGKLATEIAAAEIAGFRLNAVLGFDPQQFQITEEMDFDLRQYIETCERFAADWKRIRLFMY